MAYYAYVIYSEQHGRYYKGQCRDIKSRLIWHNQGKTRSTRPYVPWKLVYFEQFETRTEALNRERYFKTAAGRRYIKERMKKGT